MIVNIDTLAACKFKDKDVNEIYYNGVKIWPFYVDFIDTDADKDFLTFAPELLNDGLDEQRHWNVSFQVYVNEPFIAAPIRTKLYNTSNARVFAHKRIDKNINGHLVKGNWSYLKFEEAINIQHNEIVRIKWGDDKTGNFDFNWRDELNKFNPNLRDTIIHIDCKSWIQNQNVWQQTPAALYIYGKLNPFKDNTGEAIKNYEYEVGELTYFSSVDTAAVDEADALMTDLVNYSNIKYHSIHPLYITDHNIKMIPMDNINAVCYNELDYFSFHDIAGNWQPSFLHKHLETINNLTVYGQNIELYAPFSESSGAEHTLKYVNNFKIIGGEIGVIFPGCFDGAYNLEYVKLDYDGVLNADNAKDMFSYAGKNVEQPVLVKRGGAATVDRQAIGLGDNWIIKDFDE